MGENDYNKRTLRGLPVSEIVRKTRQPRGGYINPSMMETISLGEGMEKLIPEEKVPPFLLGLAVDYMTRFMMGNTREDAFAISLLGAEKVCEESEAKVMLHNVCGLDYNSVVNAIRLCGYDVCYRVGIIRYTPVEDLILDDASVNNVITMVKRAIAFWNQFGPVIKSGVTFEGGYTDTVCNGDADYLTSDTLWDFKVSKNEVNKDYTLQLLMYWRMGIHSIHREFDDIRFLGIYNPRLNKVSRISTSDIPDEVIHIIDSNIIGY